MNSHKSSHKSHAPLHSYKREENSEKLIWTEKLEAGREGKRAKRINQRFRLPIIFDSNSPEMITKGTIPIENDPP
jgi:hypothetical protein